VDWKLNDVMGATTWLYPQADVPAEEYLEAVEATFHAVALAYGDYLDKAQGFATPVRFGDAWPVAGQAQLVLPDRAHFLTRVRKEAAAALAVGLLPDQNGDAPCTE
jgi:hypothetical protein